MDWIPLLPIELRLKIYRYVIWANAKTWKTELVHTWATHNAIHTLQHMDHRRIERLLEDVGERQDLSSNQKLPILRKLNVVQQKLERMLSTTWDFLIHDANLSDVSALVNKFRSTPNVIWFSMAEEDNGRSQPGWRPYSQLKVRGIMVFKRQVPFAYVIHILEYRAVFYKLRHRLREVKDEIESIHADRPRIVICSGNIQLWANHLGDI